MKILQVVADGSPGGGTTNVLALTEDLLGQQSTVVFCSQSHSYAIREARRLGAVAYNGLDFFRGRLDSRIVTELRAVIDRVSPDVIHVHGGRAALACVRGLDQARLKRTIYTVRGYHFYRKAFPLKTFAKLAERQISRSVYRTVHVCNQDRETALSNSLIDSSSSALVIRNGIRLADIPKCECVAFNASKDRKQVAVLGRLTYQKAPHLVLDLASLLASEGFVFHIIGGGELEESVRRRVLREKIDNVVLYGEQSRGDGLQIMSSAGTYLLASRWEGLPVAPIEAMAMGLAVVVSDVNGCTEVVRDGVEGRVAQSENLQSFAAALRDVVADPVRTRKMIELGKQRVAREFTRDRVVREHLKLYEVCLSHQ